MAFFSTTALSPGSPVFRGRAAELARLLRLCREEVTRYGVIYGGRQNGKTSLLFQLLGAVEQPTKLCRIDFQEIQGARPEQVFAYLAEQIDTVVPLGRDLGQIVSAPRLKARLNEALARPEVGRLVLMLDELGALPPDSREALGNALRSFFHNRLVAPPLQKLQIIFSGGVELYTMVVSEVSSLHSVCEEIYLPDLPAPEAVTLIADGLQAAGIEAVLSETLGRAVYAQVAGHPYLTQRMGELLASAHAAGTALSLADVELAAREIVADAPPLLRRIRDDLRAHQLEEAARRLLRDRPPFDRLDDDMVRLELIGLAKRDGAHWAPRNPLLAAVFHRLLGVAAPPPEQARPATVAPDDPPTADQRILAEKRRRLHALELTAARYGIDTPPHITIEIEDLRREIQDLRRAEETSTAHPGPSTSEAAPTPADRTPPTMAAPPPPVPTPVIPKTPEQQAQPGASSANATPPAPRIANQGSALRTVEGTKAALPPWVPTLVKVPAGPFLMGSSDTDTMARDNEKPQHRLELPDYWIGKTPVTNAQFRPFVEGDGYTNPVYWTKVGWEWREQEQLVAPQWWNHATSSYAQHPVVGIGWFEAVAYCRWLTAQTGHTFRLPSEAEWEKAARGTDGLIWPWGHQWEAGRCNSAEAGINKTNSVDQFPGGASIYGAFDMVGNVWEWCASGPDKTYPYQLADEWQAAYLEADQARILRGGSWHDEQKHARASFRGGYDPRYRSINYSLRVASHSPLRGSES
ncbi:SUMF1/EgtB/PvdO family nonheme iron enzyme [Candidatus Chloroploca sp. M-50]|uniref:SUMF1/EgtB/PvdO family nonheme iron enzyme n=1 Tax=Candidatus Chloroploca mongolica TaxID=2528176 RepID=A0ABS4DA06_9CHLR|nr:SUMF1/EgtB/PvdO family nonheme iron enzyme [Candidatus Chloroploca mongolica]MBP1466270.1 SUMF1/EgtB/PvdO family nonheme iron enzyme [Candidatus Chloroploca mongolica]